MESVLTLEVAQATIYPTARREAFPDQILMGVFDSQGQFVAGSELQRNLGEVGAPMPQSVRTEFGPPVRASGPAIHAGPLFLDHYGHFLVESMARLAVARDHPDTPIAWSGNDAWRDRNPTLRPWQREILEILGLVNPVLIIIRPTTFDTVLVPPAEYRYPDRFDHKHARFLAAYEGPPQVAGSKLWLSRSRDLKDARDRNISVTEHRLAAAGWQIAYPTEMAIREQLDAIGQAEVVAGEEGSAFHTVVLLRDLEEKHFHIFRRHGDEHPNMRTIGERRGMNQSFHNIENAAVLQANGRYVRKISRNASAYLDALDVPLQPTDISQPDQQSVDLINHLMAVTDGGEYLEVGDGSGSLLNSVQARRRTAVAAQFAFDPRQLESSSVRLFEIAPSDVLHFADDLAFDVLRFVASDIGDTANLLHLLPLGRAGAACVLEGDTRAVSSMATALLEQNLARPETTDFDHPGHCVLRITAEQPRAGSASGSGPSVGRLRSIARRVRRRATRR